MDRTILDRVIHNFFDCNRDDLLAIIGEFVSALEAEERMPPRAFVSRNYETAQDNPEIHARPGNLRDARDALFPFYWGTDGWGSPLHVENVKGPASYASLLGGIACLLKNPNLCVDTYSQRSNELEVKAITALANLVFGDIRSPWGVFTMGGTISNLYAGRIGIEKVLPGAMRRGLGGTRLVGVVSSAAHYSNQTLAGWLGLGTANLVSVPVGPDCAMRLDLLAESLERLYREGARVAFVIATFGTTDAFGIDDVAGIRRVLREQAAAHGQAEPHLHVDAAVGWALCFLSEYDLDRNPLRIEEFALPAVGRARRAAQSLALADSVTVDFHKMGWGHYPSSAFIVNRREDLSLLLRDKAQMPYLSEAEARRDPAMFTLECSRPGLGPYSVMAALEGIGLSGYQALVLHTLEVAAYARLRLEPLEYCAVLNRDGCGPGAVWWVLPRGRDARAILKAAEEGTLTEEQQRRYFGEIRHLYDRRQADLDPARDARLSYTSGIGYAPHGVVLPAWKAVFFNPKSDRDVVDRIIASIEDL